MTIVARVQQDYRYPSITSCGGVTFTKHGWTNVPEGMEDEAERTGALQFEKASAAFAPPARGRGRVPAPQMIGSKAPAGTVGSAEPGEARPALTDEQQLLAMKPAELRTIAKGLGVFVGFGWSKAKVVEAILAVKPEPEASADLGAGSVGAEQLGVTVGSDAPVPPTPPGSKPAKGGKGKG